MNYFRKTDQPWESMPWKPPGEPAFWREVVAIFSGLLLKASLPKLNQWIWQQTRYEDPKSKKQMTYKGSLMRKW